jgi:hypothetical protein
MLVTGQNALNATGWVVSCGFLKMERPWEFNVTQIIEYQTVLIQDLAQLHDLNLKLAETGFS